MTIEELLKDGARAMAENRYEDAVEIYSEACQMTNLEKGKDDPNLMFLYGKALFENAVQSSDVLGGVGKEKSEKGPTTAAAAVEDEKEEEEEGQSKGKSGTKERDGQFQFNERLAEEEEEEEEEEEGEEEEGEKDTEEKANSDSDEEVEAPKEGEDGEDDREAEQSDFEIAWEILDLTRILYGEQLADMTPVAEPYHAHAENGKDFVTTFTRLSDVYMLMGDISLETENFPQAAEDYEKAYKMLEKAFDETSGRRHEALFKLSLAYEFVGSDESVQKAITCMRDLLAMVEKKKDEDDIAEEVKGRLSDLQALQKQRAAEKEQLLGLLKGVTAAGGSGAGAASSTNVRDLTGLVKSRKKNRKQPSSGRVSK